ncbi:hypothetical protein [Streptomyces sp. NBC_00102]|uniref:hypothetical protein n=1 Tax=Streptomyces sp. NBC_00102 TaxID=2975652 RepID=UPI002253506F|nr:hypothetical protein [Streptomyces sp. NBC_00102]MCX5396016.1 hypothetical protein [Streptomyces sp. NBC_00102]
MSFLISVAVVCLFVGHFLLRQERNREAVAMLRHVDGHLNGLPWRYCPKPFDALRYRALRTRAARRSLREKRRNPVKRDERRG